MTIHPSLKLLQLAKDKLRKEFIEYWYDDWKDYLDDPDIYWIGNWCILACGDIFVSMEDMVTIFESKIPHEIFDSWYWHSVENDIDHRRINLWHYAQMRWACKTHQEILEDMDKEHKRRQTPEYIAETEGKLEEIRQKGIEELKKYI